MNSQIEIFQDVSFAYPRKETERLRECLSKETTPPWRLDTNRENEVKRRSGNDVEVISFSRDSLDEIPAAYISLWNSDSLNWTLPNVVPVEFGARFSVHQYNVLVDDFLTLVLRPALRSLDISCCVGIRTLSIVDMLSDESLLAFKEYLSLGAPYSSALHPDDERRLCEFIWCLHEQHEHFDPDLFRRWLKEAENWPTDYADGLATRVDQGLTLLDARKP